MISELTIAGLATTERVRKSARAVECGDLSPWKVHGLRHGVASSGWREPVQPRRDHAHPTSTATSRLPKAVTSHRTP